MNTGALGHGLSVSVGMALAARKLNKTCRVFTLMGDGDRPKARSGKLPWPRPLWLDNLVAILDRNRLRSPAAPKTCSGWILWTKKWRSFGWSVVPVDGHDHAALSRALHAAPVQPGRPTLVLASTVKGRGVAFMEHVARWHPGVPTETEFIQALEGLQEKGGESSGQ
jgi:transketolase